ncbi:MAG: hypothetical protein JJU26_07410 [Oceanicaulis sp.]|uniref:hypothetical protein n=1 Tax=Glycocaulis sp. TaxID=1969725 RepID=UPI0025C64C4E|nr:hypothetical protein [Glycocaulis sp.]MCC5981530.1 hypothetical protein [Oceanicaulis sp.]MCH8520771.1 hypothetical protein [Glycocaulis sp.]
MMMLTILLSVMLAADDRAPVPEARIGHAERYMSTPLPDALINGLAVDIDAERLYLGGMADHSLYAVSLENPGAPERLAGPEDGLGPVYGLAIDGRARILYAATGGADDGAEPALAAYDLFTGEISHLHTMEGAGRFSDVVAQDGVVYASDAEAGRVYLLSSPRGVLEIYAEDERFGALQGLALTRGALFAADPENGIWRIDAVSREAELVEALEGDLTGFSSLATDSYGELYAVRSNAGTHGLYHIALQGFGQDARVSPLLTGHPDFDDPAGLRISDGRFFILANAQWPAFADGASASRRNPVVLYMPVP